MRLDTAFCIQPILLIHSIGWAAKRTAALQACIGQWTNEGLAPPGPAKPSRCTFSCYQRLAQGSSPGLACAGNHSCMPREPAEAGQMPYSNRARLRAGEGARHCTPTVAWPRRYLLCSRGAPLLCSTKEHNLWNVHSTSSW